MGVRVTFLVWRAPGLGPAPHEATSPALRDGSHPKIQWRKYASGPQNPLSGMARVAGIPSSAFRQSSPFRDHEVRRHASVFGLGLLVAPLDFFPHEQKSVNLSVTRTLQI